MGEDVGVFVWESREKNDHVTSLIRPLGLMYAAGQKNGHSGSAPSPPFFPSLCQTCMNIAGARTAGTSERSGNAETGMVEYDTSSCN